MMGAGADQPGGACGGRGARRLVAGGLVGLAVAVPAAARADTQDWQVNEVLTALGGDDAVRYVELYTAPGGCLFPSSRIEAFDADGRSLGAAAPSVGTVCFGPDTYFLLATSAAEATFAVTADHALVPPLPATAGQLCFASTATRYDCVRWGAIATAVTDLFGPDDTTAVAAPADGSTLARIATTHVVADDWTALGPTPRGPNDGTPWFPPDAGPTPPDAAPLDAPSASPDAAAPADASAPPDAAGPDANTAFLDLDPGGGATCSCTTQNPAAGWPILLWWGQTRLRRSSKRKRK